MIDYCLNTKWQEHLPTSPSEVKNWSFFPTDVWREIQHNEDFWLGLDTLDEAECKLEIIPELYLTARPIKTKITEQWLEKCGFPKASVITVANPSNKVSIMENICKNCVLVDDHVETVRAVRHAKLNAVLYKAPYHINEDTRGLTIISSIDEINRIGGNLNDN